MTSRNTKAEGKTEGLGCTLFPLRLDKFSHYHHLSDIIFSLLTTTLNSPITRGHNNFLQPMLNLKLRVNVGQINFQPMPNL